MSIIPETVSPKELAERLGWSEKFVRETAISLNACLGRGRCMRLTQADVVKIMEARRCPSRSTSGTGSTIAGERLVQLAADRAFDALCTPATRTLQRARLRKLKPSTGRVISMVREPS